MSSCQALPNPDLGAQGRRRARRAALILLASLLLSGGPAQAAPPMVTRQVALFAQKERTLNDAMASGDLQAIDQLVSRDFVARPGDHPARPILRAAWLQGSPARQFPGRVEQLVARPLAAGALVSFVWVLAGDAGRVAVTDLWDGADENALLLERHATPIGKAVFEQGQPEPGPSRR